MAKSDILPQNLVYGKEKTMTKNYICCSELWMNEIAKILAYIS